MVYWFGSQTGGYDATRLALAQTNHADAFRVV